MHSRIDQFLSEVVLNSDQGDTMYHIRTGEEDKCKKIRMRGSKLFIPHQPSSYAVIVIVVL
jgi:hypothetical protein